MSTNIPAGYHSLQPYLIFTDTAKAIAFYVQAFGGREKMRMQDKTGRIAHAEVILGDSVVMMADEHPEIGAYSAEHYKGSPINLMLYVEDCDATYKRALATGGTSLREPANQDYGDRMSGVLDPFGYTWWIAHPLAKSEEK